VENGKRENDEGGYAYPFASCWNQNFGVPLKKDFVAPVCSKRKKHLQTRSFANGCLRLKSNCGKGAFLLKVKTVGPMCAKDTGENRGYAEAFLALLVFAISVLLIVFVGSRIQRWNLNFGLVVTEIGLIALPAFFFFQKSRASHRVSSDENFFLVPSLRQLFGVLIIGVCTLMIATFKGLALRKELFGDAPAGTFSWSGTSWLFLGCIVLLAPLCEEFLFRVVIQSRLAGIWSNRASVLVTALLFALFHLNIVRFPETFVLGFFSGIVFLKTRNFWCSVTLHAICNALGMPLVAHAAKLQWAFNPWACILFGIAALASCYFLGEKSPGPLNGFWRRLRWAAYGTRHQPQPGGKSPLYFRAFASILCLALFLISCWPYYAAAKALTSSYVICEKDEWTILSPEKVQARSELSILQYGKESDDFLIELPFDGAVLDQIKADERSLCFTRLKGNRYRVDMAVQFPSRPYPPAVVFWHFSLSSLREDLAAGYRIPVKSLMPSTQTSLEVVAGPKSGCGLMWGKNNRQPIYNLSGKRPNIHYGSCDLGVRIKTVGK